MPCDYMRPREMTLAERMAEIDEALADLEQGLASGLVQVIISDEGAVCFSGFEDEQRRHVEDSCAYRRLTERDSWELEVAVQEAQKASGNAASLQTIGSGLHSHDGGATWSKD